MLTAITGLPGAGKTLRLVSIIEAAEKSGRPCYVHGLNGLTPGHWSPLDDPNKWQDCPDGSLICIDEAQKVWPSRRAGDPIPPVRALSEHRHRGFDFVFTTQHPTMLDSYVRKLVGEHQHVVRMWGGKASKVITWSEMFDDPQSFATRERGTGMVWAYPKHLFSRYKSATVHTVKTRIPTRLILAAGVLVLIVFLGWKAFGVLQGFKERAGDVVPEAVAASGGTVAGVTAKPVQAMSYQERFTPALPGHPWTAPAYAELTPATVPETYCISSANRCTCLSEQGTRISMEDRLCRHIARWGVYNPFRNPDGSSRPAAGPASNGSKGATAAKPLGF